MNDNIYAKCSSFFTPHATFSGRRPKKTAVKAVTAAQLSMASHGVYSVTLDEAIEAMRLTAQDMSVKYKETSLSVCLLSVLKCAMALIWWLVYSNITQSAWPDVDG
jgi:hypothetical protein